ncbi:MAG: translation elongation factor EF-P [Lentisphaeria bacterium]|nr:translation elongation factor EF-P [Lentisphaeria bacterium]
MLAKQIKNGSILTVNGAPHVVESVEKHTPSARGAATLYKIRARNLLTQTKTDLSCKGEEGFPEPDFQSREVQYLYPDGDAFVFMDIENYEQYVLGDDVLRGQDRFLVPDMEGIFALVLEGRVAGLRLPDVVEMTLVECDPGIKGNSATSRTKPAKTQTGLTVQVPEYMENGECVRVDTRDGRFLGRAT